MNKLQKTGAKASDGAVVPGVTITITNAAGTAGFRRLVTTDNNGSQRILQVPPGKYNFRSDAKAGFAAKTFRNIQVVSGKATPVKMGLTVG